MPLISTQGGAEAGPIVDAVTGPEFDRLMAALGGFEPAPTLAVAVSGGADSMALALLCRNWVKARDGRLLALTVDHGLRPESAAEAALVSLRLAALGIETRCLAWTGPAPSTGIQAAARTARHALLEEACARTGILHLLLAHHRDDQAETVLLRLAGRSGLRGLAGMAAVSESATMRRLRPLLTVPSSRLRATCRQSGIEWIEDPSNADPRFTRPRLRAIRAPLARAGLTPERLADLAGRLGAARRQGDAWAASLLARTVTMHGEGYAILSTETWRDWPADVVRHALAACLMCLGGRPYPPRGRSLDRVAAALTVGGRSISGGDTLAGCRLLPNAVGVLLCREPAAIIDWRTVQSEASILWDRRFTLAPTDAAARAGVVVARLGSQASRRRLRALDAAGRLGAIPAAVLPSLPGLWRGETLLAVPHLQTLTSANEIGARVRFQPATALTTAGFAVAPRGCRSTKGDYL